MILILLSFQKISAETLYNLSLPGREIVIWTSQEGFLGCMQEVKITGTPGGVCTQAILAIVPSGTMVRKISGGGYEFPKIQVLGRSYGGITGHVPRRYIR